MLFSRCCSSFLHVFCFFFIRKWTKHVQYPIPTNWIFRTRFCFGFRFKTRLVFIKRHYYSIHLVTIVKYSHCHSTFVCVCTAFGIRVLNICFSWKVYDKEYRESTREHIKWSNGPKQRATLNKSQQWLRYDYNMKSTSNFFYQVP